MVSADLELRIRLEPYDDHDDVLDSLSSRLSSNQLRSDDQLRP